MEENLEALAKEVLERDNVVGFLCADTTGLPIIANGIANKAHSPTLVKVAELASKLNEHSKDSMAISIDTDSYRIFVKPSGKAVTALYKRY